LEYNSNLLLSNSITLLRTFLTEDLFPPKTSEDHSLFLFRTLTLDLRSLTQLKLELKKMRSKLYLLLVLTSNSNSLNQSSRSDLLLLPKLDPKALVEFLLGRDQ
jgi:hypothetical protein